ncbi:hypothetical protein OG21DRAFT_227770 [Imleria badia]|nr:hypothetical protein OG21DRAFT_227770 [Imleria badia]
MMGHSKRIQELILYLPELRTRQIFFKLSSCAPCLQNLDIFMFPTRRVASEWPSELFHGDAPVLRTLELTHCPVPWYSLKLSGLTTLSLRDVPEPFIQNTEPRRVVCKTSRVYTSLVSFMTAQSVSLARRSMPSRGSICPIFLAFYSSLPLSTVIAFLYCVNILLKTELRLGCYSEGDSSLDDYATLSSLLAQRFSISEDRTL